MTDLQSQLLDRVAKAMGYTCLREHDNEPVGYLYQSAQDGRFRVFPWTLDSAAKCLPPGWEWMKYDDDLDKKDSVSWLAMVRCDAGPRWLNVSTPDTGDEIHDRYTLAALAWESQVSQSVSPVDPDRQDTRRASNATGLMTDSDDTMTSAEAAARSAKT